MIGIEFDTAEHAEEVQWACFERGLLVLECGKSSVRMSPALTVTRGRDGDRAAHLRRGRRARSPAMAARSSPRRDAGAITGVEAAADPGRPASGIIVR